MNDKFKKLAEKIPIGIEDFALGFQLFLCIAVLFFSARHQISGSLKRSSKEREADIKFANKLKKQDTKLAGKQKKQGYKLAEQAYKMKLSNEKNKLKQAKLQNKQKIAKIKKKS